MQLIKSISEMKTWSYQTRQAGQFIGFIPTMGALHDGHASLVRIAKQKADRVVVSIFVNPLQFGPQEDFNRYPRTSEKDLELLKQEEVDVVFFPRVKNLYPHGFQTQVEITELSTHLCGKTRPGHFQGVATVVLKLFQIIAPHVAVFGNKDFQQRVIIERMVQDLHLNIDIIAVPIIRETDGLAMSSRNVYLSEDERKRALVLNRALKRAEEMFKNGERNTAALISEISQMIDNESPTHIDYIKICNAKTLEEVYRIEEKAVLALAVYFGRIRLIDNVVLDSS